MNIPENLLYTKEHEWVKIEGDIATVGISDHAQHALGDITFADLPKPGAAVTQFKLLASVESVKAASDVYAPISGSVTEVNQALSTQPELINRSPYEEGWIAKISITDPGEKDNLLDAAAYSTYLETLT